MFCCLPFYGYNCTLCSSASAVAPAAPEPTAGAAWQRTSTTVRNLLKGTTGFCGRVLVEPDRIGFGPSVERVPVDSYGQTGIGFRSIRTAKPESDRIFICKNKCDTQDEQGICTVDDKQCDGCVGLCWYFCIVGSNSESGGQDIQESCTAEVKQIDRCCERSVWVSLAFLRFGTFVRVSGFTGSTWDADDGHLLATLRWSLNACGLSTASHLSTAQCLATRHHDGVQIAPVRGARKRAGTVPTSIVTIFNWMFKVVYCTCATRCRRAVHYKCSKQNIYT